MQSTISLSFNKLQQSRSPDKTDVFLSYHWGTDKHTNLSNHQRVGTINEGLRARGIITQLNSDQKLISAKELIPFEIQHTKIVLIFITTRYIEKIEYGDKDEHCAIEFRHASELASDKLMPIILEPAMRVRPWIGAVGKLLNNHIYFDFSDNMNFEIKMNGLCNAIMKNLLGNRWQMGSKIDDNSTHISSSQHRHLKSLSSAEVILLFNSIGIASCEDIVIQQHITGEKLASISTLQDATIMLCQATNTHIKAQNLYSNITIWKANGVPISHLLCSPQASTSTPPNTSPSTSTLTYPIKIGTGYLTSVPSPSGSALTTSSSIPSIDDPLVTKRNDMNRHHHHNNKGNNNNNNNNNDSLRRKGANSNTNTTTMQQLQKFPVPFPLIDRLLLSNSSEDNSSYHNHVLLTTSNNQHDINNNRNRLDISSTHTSTSTNILHPPSPPPAISTSTSTTSHNLPHKNNNRYNNTNNNTSNITYHNNDNTSAFINANTNTNTNTSNHHRSGGVTVQNQSQQSQSLNSSFQSLQMSPIYTKKNTAVNTSTSTSTSTSVHSPYMIFHNNDNNDNYYKDSTNSYTNYGDDNYNDDDGIEYEESISHTSNTINNTNSNTNNAANNNSGHNNNNNITNTTTTNTTTNTTTTARSTHMNSIRFSQGSSLLHPPNNNTTTNNNSNKPTSTNTKSNTRSNTTGTTSTTNSNIHTTSMYIGEVAHIREIQKSFDIVMSTLPNITLLLEFLGNLQSLIIIDSRLCVVLASRIRSLLLMDCCLHSIDICINTLEIILLICYNNNENQVREDYIKILSDNDICHTICSIIIIHSNRADIVELICIVLCILVLKSENRDIFLHNETACTALITGIRTHIIIPTVAEEGCRSIVSLSSDGNSNIIGSYGACKVVMGALRAHILMPTVVGQACEAVGYLADNNENNSLLGEMDACKGVLAILKTHINHAAVVAQAAWALGNLASYCDNNLRLLAAGACKILPSTLRCHITIPIAAQHLCFAIASLADNDTTRLELFREGACKVVLYAVTTHSSIANVVEQGCWAIGNLAMLDECRFTLGTLDVSELLVTVLRTHVSVAAVVENVMWTLVTLAVAEDMRADLGETGCCEALVPALLTNISDTAVATQGCWAIVNLAVIDDNRYRFGAAGACEALVNVLGVHNRDAAIIEQACWAVLNLIWQCDENKQRLLNCGIVGVLKDITNCDELPTGVRYKAQDALGKLSPEPPQRTVVSSTRPSWRPRE